MRRICVWIAKQIWSIAGDERRIVAQSRSVKTRSDGAERQATVIDNDSGGLPAAQNFTDEVFLLLEERQFVDVIDRQHMSTIKCGALVFVPDVIGILRRVAAIV